jgi:hypothetical protein
LRSPAAVVEDGAGAPRGDGVKDILVAVLESAYTIAHHLGTWILHAVRLLVPQVGPLDDLADPVGVMAVLTIAVLIAQVARKLMWIVVAVGWALVAIRVALALGGLSGGGRT